MTGDAKTPAVARGGIARSSRFALRLPANADVVAAVTLFAVIAVLYNPYKVIGEDGTMYYGFVRRLFGAHDHALAGMFGLAYLNAPFYAIGKGLASAGVGKIVASGPPEALVTIAGTFYGVAALLVTARFLRDLGMERRGLAIGAAGLGMPLLYYSTVQPVKTHAGETFLVAVALVLLVALTRRLPGDETSRRTLLMAAAVGAVLGFATATRYPLVAMVGGLLLALLIYRRWRVAAVVAVSSAVTFGLLLIGPESVHAGITGGPVTETTAHFLSFAPLSPLRMLFANERGLFIWSPVALLGLIGYVRLVLRDRARRELWVQIALMYLGYFIFFASVPIWWAGWSFSQRYFTSAVPLVALGIAELLRWRLRPALVLTGLATLWTLFLFVNVTIGLTVVPERASASFVAEIPVQEHVGPHLYLWAMWRATLVHNLSH